MRGRAKRYKKEEGKKHKARDRNKGESVSVCNAWMYGSVALETPAAWIMSWLVALLLEAPPTGLPPLNRVCTCYLGHGLMNKPTCTHTRTHIHIHIPRVFVQTHTVHTVNSLTLLLAAHCIHWSHHLSASTSQSFALHWTLPLCLSVCDVAGY